MSSKRYCLVGVFCPCHKSTIQRKLSYKGCICFIFTIALCICILCFMILFKNDLLYINTNIHVCTAPCLTIYMCINLLYSNETILCALKNRIFCTTTKILLHILFSAATRKGHCILPSVYHQSIYNIKEPFAYQLKIAIEYNLLYSNKRMLIWTIAGHRSLSLLEIVWTPSNRIIFALCFYTWLL